MKATVYHVPRDMRIEQVPDPTIAAPADVLAGTFDPSLILDMMVELDGCLRDTRQWMNVAPSKC